MRLAIVSIWDAQDVRAWSGIPFYMSRALAANGVDVEHVSPLPTPSPRYRYARWWLSHRVLRRSYRTELDATVLRSYRSFIEERLESIRPDAVLTTNTLVADGVGLRWPLAFWTDATLHRLRETYSEYALAGRRAFLRGVAVEARTLEQAKLGIYASRWAADSAEQHYGFPEGRTEVVPFGANLDTVGTAAQVLEAIRGRTRADCKLVFIGVDWQRKRGGFAVEIARILNEGGLPTTIDLFGSEPPADEPLPSWAHAHGFVAKDRPEGRALIERCLRQAHFLVLPSTSECLGIAIAEANAWGVPCLGAAVGGIPDMIRSGVTGFTLDPRAQPVDYAEKIREARVSREAYERLAAASQHEYAGRLNWDAAAARVVDRLDRALARE